MAEILIGYIKQFEYSNPDAKSILGDQPNVGRIYRILKSDVNNRPDTYQIYIGHESNRLGLSTIYLGPELYGEYEGSTSSWSFKIDIVTKENFVDFDFHPDDLKKLKEWMESNNADIADLLSKRPVAVPIANLEEAKQAAPIIKELLGKNKAITDAMDRSAQALTKILHGNKDFFIAVADVLENFTSRYLSAENLKRPSLAFLMESSKDSASFQAIRAIEEYCWEEADDEDALYEAIFFLLLEKQRRNTIASRYSGPNTDSTNE